MAAIALAFVIAVNAEGRVPHEERASEAPASALVIQSSTTPNPAMSRRTTRRLGDVIIVEQDGARLTDIDVRAIQSVLAPKGAWWLYASMRNAETVLGVDACMQPDVATSDLRRGECVEVMRYPVKGWTRSRDVEEFAQLVVGGQDLTMQQPARILRFLDAPRIADDTLIEVMTVIRRKAVPAETPRRKSDVQPYPFNRIAIGDTDRIIVELRHAELPIYQQIIVEKFGDEWRIVEMM